MKNNEKEKLNLLTDISIFGQYAWLLNLYRFDKITEKQFLKFVKEFDLSRIELEKIFYEIIISADNSPFDWDDWEIEELKTGKVYNSQDAQDWLLFGFIFFAIDKKTLSFISQEDYNKKAIWLYSETTTYLKILSSGLETKWRVILPQLTTIEFSERLSWLKASLDQLNENYTIQDDLSIIRRPLSGKNVQKFKELNYASWIRKPPIYKLFERYENLELIESNERTLNKINGCDHLIIKGKHLFLEEELDYLISFSEYGHNLRENEINIFLGMLPKTKDVPQYEKLEGGLDYLIDKLNQKGYEPNLIIMNRKLTLYDREFRNVLKFNSTFFSVEKFDRLLTDTYDNIPIFYFDHDKFKNKVMVCQFDRLMKMYQKRPEGWYNNLLNIQVKEVDEEEIERRLKTEPKKWLFDDQGKEISKEEAVVKLKKSVIIYVGSEIEFEVLDSEACEACIIKSVAE